ncbi:MAG: hypothetical protein CMH63_00710 [Nanoarchaeota archaeon]|jgi:hypothetical protein|nr:hypothetical protein [Nanoarchaeota archaeon]|tara:strand:+ start:21613 stop:22032 length:420 start_codon:yes stop_codon:yes gene_type:complete
MNGFGKYTRALNYTQKLEGKSKIDIKDFRRVQDLKKRLKHTGMKLRSLELTRIFFFILLYSSVVSAFTSFIPGSEIITGNLAKIGSVIGSTVSLVIIGILSKTIALYILDLNMISAHLIAIYSKHAKHRNIWKKKKQKR